MKKKIRILEVYYEPSISGITRHIGQFVIALKETEFKFYILCSTNDKKIIDFYKDLNIPIKGVPGAKYFSFRGFLEVINLVKKYNIDIVHIHNLQSIFWANIPKLFTPHKKYFFTPHIISFENKIIEKIFYFIWKFFSKLSDKIILLSKYQKENLLNRKVCRENKLLVIPNSIPPINELRDLEETAQYQDKYIISIMRLVRQKNPEQIISIAKIICEKYPALKFFIVGEGELINTLLDLINKNNLTNKVLLLGHREDALKLINNAMIFLSTSLWEGMPYTLLEAMYLKKPIVASNIDGHKDLIISGKTGYLVNSINDYVEKISLLLENENRRTEIGNNAQKHFQDNFSFDIFIEKIKSLYYEI